MEGNKMATNDAPCPTHAEEFGVQVPNCRRCTGGEGQSVIGALTSQLSEAVESLTEVTPNV